VLWLSGKRRGHVWKRKHSTRIDERVAYLPQKKEEVANAALHILRPHISAPVEDIIRETSRLFGFQRVGSAVEDRIRAGLGHLISSGFADEVAGRLTVRDR